MTTATALIIETGKVVTIISRYYSGSKGAIVTKYITKEGEVVEALGLDKIKYGSN
jgi:hypothetical protein